MYHFSLPITQHGCRRGTDSSIQSAKAKVSVARPGAKSLVLEVSEAERRSTRSLWKSQQSQRTFKCKCFRTSDYNRLKVKSATISLTDFYRFPAPLIPVPELAMPSEFSYRRDTADVIIKIFNNWWKLPQLNLNHFSISGIPDVVWE